MIVRSSEQNISKIIRKAVLIPMKMNRMTFTATFDKEIIESPSAGEYRVCDQYNNEKVFDFFGKCNGNI